MEDMMADYMLDDIDYEQEYYDDMMEYDDSMMEEGAVYTRLPLTQVFEQCMLPTIQQTAGSVLPLMVLCIVCKMCANLCTESIDDREDIAFPKVTFHLSSAICGLMACHLFFHADLLYMLMLGILAYTMLALANWKCRQFCGSGVAVITVLYLLICELFLVEGEKWHQIRGAQMVLAMKVISVGFDLSNSSIEKLPAPWEFLGYIFNVGTVIFGPFVSFTDYSAVLLQSERLITWHFIKRLLGSFAISLVCVVISACVTYWLILDDSGSWMLAYRDAQSFRFSHYFISFLSEVTTLCSGLSWVIRGNIRDINVSRPYHIELPRSLVEVVSKWNLPMHYWLKTYVFKSAIGLGNFTAILLTYIASAILHGLNFQLAAVLLSLGFYTYTEYVLRKRLSRIFDACIQAKKCKEDCTHQFKSSHIYVRVVNVLFGCLAMFHLAYLGMMFDSSATTEQGYTMEHTLSKWAHLGYMSHIVAIGSYIFYFLI